MVLPVGGGAGSRASPPRTPVPSQFVIWGTDGTTSPLSPIDPSRHCARAGRGRVLLQQPCTPGTPGSGGDMGGTGNTTGVGSGGNGSPAGSGGNGSPTGSGGDGSPTGSGGNGSPAGSGGNGSPAGSGGSGSPAGSGGSGSPAGSGGNGGSVGTGGAAPARVFPTQACLDKATALVAMMTADEKIAQLHQVERANTSAADITQYSVGSVYSQGGSGPAADAPAGWAKR